MTVIYSNMRDEDCLVLQRAWRDIPNVNLIEITPDSPDWEDMVDDAVSRENDNLLFFGHGTERGLLFPDFSREEYILHENNVGLIHARNVVCCWCYASSFCVRHDLSAFATSMFISNVGEAYDNGIYGYGQEQISSCNVSVYDEINGLLRHGVPLSEWVMRIGAHADVENAIDTFNRQGMCFFLSRINKPKQQRIMRELTERQRKAIEGFDTKKPVKFRYDVVDCEHEGDISSAENEVRRYVNELGGDVTDTFWEGEDCGEAYIECSVPFQAVERALKDGFLGCTYWQD